MATQTQTDAAQEAPYRHHLDPETMGSYYFKGAVLTALKQDVAQHMITKAKKIAGSDDDDKVREAIEDMWADDFSYTMPAIYKVVARHFRNQARKAGKPLPSRMWLDYADSTYVGYRKIYVAVRKLVGDDALVTRAANTAERFPRRDRNKARYCLAVTPLFDIRALMTRNAQRRIENNRLAVEALQRIRSLMESWIATGRKCRAELAERVASNPLHAIEWCESRLVEIHRGDVAARIRKILEGGDFTAARAEVIHMRNNLIRGDGFPNSTSMAHNLAVMTKAKAESLLVRAVGDALKVEIPDW